MGIVAAQKQALRAELLAARKAMPPEARQNADQMLFERFVHSALYRRADTLLCYVSCGFEADTRRILNAALSDQKRVAVPECTDAHGAMCFKRIQSLSDLTPGRFQIPAPASHCPEVRDFENAVCLVPGLAFSTDGYRIGYGKGYYDRFLRNFSGISVGICYTAFIRDAIPHDEWDVPVQWVLTEQSAAGGTPAANHTVWD